MTKSVENIPFCDVFYPTTKEFADFENYMEKIVKAAKSGIFKVRSNYD
jgi:hypothetical protein